MLTSEVDNFPGFPEGIMGPELMENMKKQAIRFGSEFRQENVVSVDFNKRPFILKTDSSEILANSIIIATGAETLWLGVPNEKELIGRGISSCAPCDAPFFKEKEVLVVGGGDSAMEEALVLTKYAKKVTIIHRREEFKASKAMQEKVFANEKINIEWNLEVQEVIGKDKFEGVKVKNNKTGEEKEIKADGMFVAIGHSPTSSIFKGAIKLDEKGYIVPTLGAKTNIEGVFVSGDIHDHIYKQAITAAGYGCMAGMEAVNYISGLTK
jgi:thioredoxin reductase (NADPH)